MQGLSETQLLMALTGLAIIVLAARAAAELARRLHQPQVLGELIAGVALGPSLLGAIAPGLQRALFSEPTVARVFSAFSWLGAILLLLIAGLEVDLFVVRREAKAGAAAAIGAILSGLGIGALFSRGILHHPWRSGFFLGVVMSVTAVSVMAKVLIEREVLRRRYAQVMLVGGIAAEVVVWLLVPAASVLQGAATPSTVLRAAAFAVAYFIFMMTLGRQAIYWAMRQVADGTAIQRGQLSLVLVLALFSAALTEILGLHALLGAFVFGVVLSDAPRTNRPLLEGIETLTSSFFAPVFFVLAGMRVNVLSLQTTSAWGAVLLLLVLGSIGKAGVTSIAARLGGIRGWEAALVGLGLNFKGGTDVVVAIVGVELGLLSPDVYTMYTVAAILTVLASPSVLTWLERRAPPSPEEAERLQKEEATRRSYTPGIERVLVPVAPQVVPTLAADFIQWIAQAKRKQGEIFDITEFRMTSDEGKTPDPRTKQAAQRLEAIEHLENVQVEHRPVRLQGILRKLLQASEGHQLIAVGAHMNNRRRGFSFGHLQDAILHRAQSDVLIVSSEQEHLASAPIRNILVPINGMEHSFAAADLAACVALETGAKLVLFSAVRPDLDAFFWRERDHRELIGRGNAILDEVAFRVGRLGVDVVKKIELGDFPGKVILRELKRHPYDLMVMGALDRGRDGKFSLGSATQNVLVESKMPTAVLISHEVRRPPID